MGPRSDERGNYQLLITGLKHDNKLQTA